MDEFISPEIDYRRDFADLCNRRSLLGHAIEIGTDRGTFAASFLDRWRGAVLWCVDPYPRAAPGSQYDDLMQWDRDADYQLAIQSLARHTGRVRMLRHPFSEAIPWILGPLDFVYVDGNHVYEHVKSDLELAWPRIRAGGILAGHDFSDRKPGVLRAVREFASEHARSILYTDPDQPDRRRNHWPSWYLYKPAPETFRFRYSARYVTRLIDALDAAVAGRPISEAEKLLPEHVQLIGPMHD